MRLPYRRHLLWLVATGSDEAAVRRYYQENSFPFPPEDTHSLDFESLRLRADQELLLPNGGRRRIERRRFSEVDLELLTKMGYGDLYTHTLAPDRLGEKQVNAWAQIQALIENPVLRVAVECAILAKAPPADVPDLIQLGFRQTFGIEAYELYRDVYFDVKGFTKEDWKAYLAICAGDNFTYTRYFAALTKPRDEVFYLLGLPTEKQFSDFLKNVLLTADHKFKYWARMNDAGAEDQARKWALIGIEAGEKHSKHAKKDIRNFADEVQSSFEYVENDIPMATGEMLTDARPVEDQASQTVAADSLLPGTRPQDNETV